MSKCFPMWTVISLVSFVPIYPDIVNLNYLGFNSLLLAASRHSGEACPGLDPGAGIQKSKLDAPGLPIAGAGLSGPA